MPNITTCPQCAKCYEECSEEFANYPGRLCNTCFEKAKEEKERIEKAGPDLLQALEKLKDEACKVQVSGPYPPSFSNAINKASAEIRKARKGS